MDQPAQLVLFDVDGTLTNADTMFAYAGFAAGQARLYLAMSAVSPALLGMQLGMVGRGQAKGMLLRACFTGLGQDALEDAAARFADEALPGLLRPGARQRLQEHRDAGDAVWLVSASLDLWLAPIAEALGAGLICTRAAWDRGRFVGLDGANCRGPEKVRRVRAQLDMDRYLKVVAYGDSSGDREMLAMADEAHFQPFREARGG